MKTMKTSKIIIHLSSEETALLKNTLSLLINNDREINNPEVDEVEFDSESDKELIAEILDEADEITCSF